MDNLISKKFNIKKITSLFCALALCLAITCVCSAAQSISDYGNWKLKTWNAIPHFGKISSVILLSAKE